MPHQSLAEKTGGDETEGSCTLFPHIINLWNATEGKMKKWSISKSWNQAHTGLLQILRRECVCVCVCACVKEKEKEQHFRRTDLHMYMKATRACSLWVIGVWFTKAETNYTTNTWDGLLGTFCNWSRSQKALFSCRICLPSASSEKQIKT